MPLCLLITIAVASVHCYHPFVDVLYQDAFAQVKELVESRKKHRLISINESQYRNLILPGSPYFRSIVLFIDMTDEEHVNILTLMSDVSTRFPDASSWNSDADTKSERVLFFYLDISDDETNWISHLHRIRQLPEIVRVGRLRSLHERKALRIDSFNTWILDEPHVAGHWTRRKLFTYALKFCSLDPNDVGATKPSRGLVDVLRQVWKIVSSRMLVCLVAALVIVIGTYMFFWHRRLLLISGSLIVYAVNISCIISAFITYVDYGKQLDVSSQGLKDRILNSWFTDNAKTQYFHECIIVTFIILLMSLCLFVSSNALGKEMFWLSSIAMALLVVLANVMLMIIRHKKIPYSLDFLPDPKLPRGPLYVDRGIYF